MVCQQKVILVKNFNFKPLNKRLGQWLVGRGSGSAWSVGGAGGKHYLKVFLIII